eukprot:730894_1
MHIFKKQFTIDQSTCSYMANWPEVLRWVTGFWCFSTLSFALMMIVIPSFSLSVFHSNIEDYKRFFGDKKINLEDEQRALRMGTNEYGKANERHLQRLIGIQAVGRALYGIFAIISGDDNQIVSFCICNIIADSMSMTLYWSSRNIIMKFQVHIHLVIMGILNLLQLVFVCLSASNYKLKSD